MEYNMSANNFCLEGLVPAVFTPLTHTGDLNLAVIPEYVKFLRDKDITSVFVNGSTGEGSNLTIEERKQVAQAWISNRQSLKNVVIHVGGANIRESQDLATHAASIRADAIGLMPPSFFKPTSVETLVQYCKEVAVKAPNTPFYYYHIPAMSGVSFNMLEFQEQMAKLVPTYRGIKYSNWDMTEASLLHNYAGCVYNIVFGVDQQFLAAMSFGLRGAIGSTYNFMAPIYHRMITAFHRGDVTAAAKHQLQTQQALDVMFKYGSGVSILKEVMNMCVEFDLGPVRLPLVTALPRAQAQRLRDALTDLSFFDWIK